MRQPTLRDRAGKKWNSRRIASRAKRSRLIRSHSWCHSLAQTSRSLAESSICLQPIQSAGQIDAVVLCGLPHERSGLSHWRQRIADRPPQDRWPPRPQLSERPPRRPGQRRAHRRRLEPDPQVAGGSLAPNPRRNRSRIPNQGGLQSGFLTVNETIHRPRVDPLGGRYFAGRCPPHDGAEKRDERCDILWQRHTATEAGESNADTLFLF